MDLAAGCGGLKLQSGFGNDDSSLYITTKSCLLFVSAVCMSVVNPLSFFVEEKLGLPHKLFSNMTMNELQSIVSSTSGENVLMRTHQRKKFASPYFDRCYNSEVKIEQDSRKHMHHCMNKLAV